MGAIIGCALGSARALALPSPAVHHWTWAVAMPAMWALGWTATTLGAIHVEERRTAPVAPVPAHLITAVPLTSRVGCSRHRIPRGVMRPPDPPQPGNRNERHP